MKNKIKICTLSILIISLFFSFTAYANNLDKLNKDKKDVKSKIKETQKSLQEKNQEKTSLLSQINQLDDALEKVQDELDELNTRLSKTETNLKNETENLKIATEKKENQYKTLKTRMRIMYENRDTGYLQVLLDAKGFSDFFRKLEYIEYIMKYDDKVLSEYEKIELNIENSVQKIKNDKQNITNIKEKTELKNNELQNNIKNKQQIAKKITKEQNLLDQKINDLKKEDNEISRLITQAKIKATGSSNNKIYSSPNGRLAYPVPQYIGRPYNDVYGYRKNPISGKNELHSGLDLKATYGCDIVSADDGIVIYSGRRGGYGNTVIIDHGNGLSTLYAHNSKLVVKKGQRVKRGQVVAKAGSTGYSTGVHAHFEVRINGKHTNPAPYLK